MITLEELLKDDTLQSLNDDKLKRFTIKKDKYSRYSIAAVSEAINQIYSDALSDDGQTVYEARCLAAAADPTGAIVGETGGEGINSKFLVKVIARIPKLHAAIPKPDQQFCDLQRNLCILMHPVFYAKQDSDSVPQPGNIVQVRFFTNGQGQFGEYIGITDPTQIAAATTTESAKDKLEDGETPSDTLGDANNREQEAANG